MFVFTLVFIPFENFLSRLSGLLQSLARVHVLEGGGTPIVHCRLNTKDSFDKVEVFARCLVLINMIFWEVDCVVLGPEALHLNLIIIKKLISILRNENVLSPCLLCE